MRVEAFFCLDFFVTFFIKKKSKATGSQKLAIRQNLIFKKSQCIDYEYFESNR